MGEVYTETGMPAVERVCGWTGSGCGAGMLLRLEVGSSSNLAAVRRKIVVHALRRVMGGRVGGFRSAKRMREVSQL
jgi:hypothetical protein